MAKQTAILAATCDLWQHSLIDSLTQRKYWPLLTGAGQVIPCLDLFPQLTNATE